VRVDHLEQQPVRRAERSERAAVPFVGGLRHPAGERAQPQVGRHGVAADAVRDGRIGVRVDGRVREAEVLRVQVEQTLTERAQVLDLGRSLGRESETIRPGADQRGDLAERVPARQRDEDVVGRLHDRHSLTLIDTTLHGLGCRDAADTPSRARLR
jgi:hypothetical protein